MNKMCVFSDSVNESFGYGKVVWGGNSYLIDYSNEEALIKLLYLATGEEDLGKAISLVPDDLLKQTPYGKFHEEVCDKNWVLYRVDQYKVEESNDGNYLHYCGENICPEKPINCSSLDKMFQGCMFPKLLNLSHWDVSRIKSMNAVFRSSRFYSLDLSTWDTSSVEDMSYLFASCTCIRELSIDDWDVSRVKDMTCMFHCCRSLRTLDLTSWDVSSVENMTFMFYECRSLISLELGKWNTRHLSSMCEMFAHCVSLVTLDLSGWCVSGVEAADGVFNCCLSLRFLNVANWRLHSEVRLDSMFYKCISLVSIGLSGWSERDVTMIRSSLCQSFPSHNSDKRFANLLGGV